MHPITTVVLLSKSGFVASLAFLVFALPACLPPRAYIGLLARPNQKHRWRKSSGAPKFKSLPNDRPFRRGIGQSLPRAVCLRGNRRFHRLPRLQKFRCLRTSFRQAPDASRAASRICKVSKKSTDISTSTEPHSSRDYTCLYSDHGPAP